MAAVSAALPVIIGLIVLTGWASQSYSLTQFFTSRSAMQPTTAVCAIAIGLGIVATIRPKFGHMTPPILAAFVAVAALFTLAQHVSGIELGTDHLLFPKAVDEQPITYLYPGRMAAMSASNLHSVRGRRSRSFCHASMAMKRSQTSRTS
jgi:uncharacterized membrane protein YwzB